VNLDAISKLPPLPASPRVDHPSPAAPARDTGTGPGFDAILQSEVRDARPLDFSAHAQSRLLSRRIQLSDAQIARLQHGVDQAAQKGARDSLVMMDNLAFIVSVANRKVVTAIDGATTQGNVFTQIDSAVIV
jgi:flagellar operon protein